MARLAIALTRTARRHLAMVLAESGERHGDLARERYLVLIQTAIEDLATAPGRQGTRMVGDHMHYHIRFSRDRVPNLSGRVGRPRHILIAKVVGSTLYVLALAHDRTAFATRHRRARTGRARGLTAAESLEAWLRRGLDDDSSQQALRDHDVDPRRFQPSGSSACLSATKRASRAKGGTCHARQTPPISRPNVASGPPAAAR